MTAPRDVLTAIEAWLHRATHGAETGRCELVVQDGEIRELNTSNQVKPAPNRENVSPCCDAALVNHRDMDSKADCAACGRAWSYWRIRRMKARMEAA